MRFLLDTNVISELTRNAPNSQAIKFLSEQNDLWLPSIVIHEIEYGLRLLPQGWQRDRLYAMQSRIISLYDDRILPLDRASAECAAQFRVEARRAGHTLDLGDALIAGIAKANALTIATRNIADFQSLNVATFNPWETP